MLNLSAIPLPAKIYILLFLLFWIGILGLFILACRTSNRELGKENVSYSVVAVEFFAPLYEMAENLGFLTIFVIFVFSLLGWIFFPLSLMPFSLLRRLGFN